MNYMALPQPVKYEEIQREALSAQPFTAWSLHRSQAHLLHRVSACYGRLPPLGVGAPCDRQFACAWTQSC